MLRRLALAALLALAPSLACAQFAVIAPTAPVTSNGDQIANTQWVNNFFATGLPLANGKIFIGSVGGLAVAQTPSGDWTIGNSGVATLATVNANVGGFGSQTTCVNLTVNAKGLITAITSGTCTPAIGSITGLGTGIATALGINVGTAGSVVVNGGALGTPSSGTLTSATGLPISTGLTGAGTGVLTALGVNVGSAGAPVLLNGAAGTPSSITLTNGTGLPTTTGLTGTLQAAQEPAHTGDMTNTAGSLATTVLKTNGVSFAASATTDATNAANITSGSLPTARLALSQITNSLGADVALNNTSNYFDGPSIAQGSTGTWFVSGCVVVTDTTAGPFPIIKLWDGTTVIASGFVYFTANNTASGCLSGYMTSPAGNLRISVRMTSSTTGSIKFNVTGNSKDSTISAFRIN